MNLEQILLMFPYKSETITKYNESFLTAKKDFGKAFTSARGEVGGGKKYDYAKISDIYEAVEDSLHSNSLYITHQIIALSLDQELLITTIMHVSGEFMRDIRLNISEKPGNQGRGSANTYCRKYAILCLCGLSTTDDDGAEEQKHLLGHVSPQQAEEIRALLKENDKDEAKMLLHYKIPNIYHLNNQQYNQIKNTYKKK